MQVSIEINPNVEQELKKYFTTDNVKQAIESLVNSYVDRRSQEREIAGSVLRGLDEVKSGDSLSLEEFKASLR